MAGRLPGFDPAVFREAIHFVQNMGAPEDAEMRATFYFPKAYGSEVARDDEMVPFDPATPVGGTTTRQPLQVPVAVRYVDRDGELENFGAIIQSKLVLTLLDVDYVRVKGFEYVVIGGEQYLYHHTEPPAALGSVTVWNVHVTARDEA